MALKKRERNLAIATGVLGVVFVGNLLWSLLGGSGAPLTSRREQLRGQVETQNQQIGRGNEAEARLAEWRKRSLPSDLEAARSLYQNWLFTSAEAAGFQGTNAAGSAPRKHGETYTLLPFTLQATATLDKLTEFLHAFYSAGYLHQIKSLTFAPLDEGKKVKVNFVIEAMVLPGADRVNELPGKPARPLLPADASQYAKTIGDRNVFAPFRKPDPPADPPSEFDPGKYVYLTAIVAVADQPQAWIVNRTSGECLKLHQGDDFKVGDHQGKIQRIGRREAEIELNGKPCLLLLGKDLDSSAKPK